MRAVGVGKGGLFVSISVRARSHPLDPTITGRLTKSLGNLHG